jgi:hypothetical protein
MTPYLPTVGHSSMTGHHSFQRSVTATTHRADEWKQGTIPANATEVMLPAKLNEATVTTSGSNARQDCSHTHDCHREKTGEENTSQTGAPCHRARRPTPDLRTVRNWARRQARIPVGRLLDQLGSAVTRDRSERSIPRQRTPTTWLLVPDCMTPVGELDPHITDRARATRTASPTSTVLPHW